jgi:hypothetical protein
MTNEIRNPSPRSYPQITQISQISGCVHLRSLVVPFFPDLRSFACIRGSFPCPIRLRLLAFTCGSIPDSGPIPLGVLGVLGGSFLPGFACIRVHLRFLRLS